MLVRAVTLGARSARSLAALLAGLFALPGIASAHLLVVPATSTAGATQLYTIAVPNEKLVDIVKVEVQFPKNLVVLQLQAPPGWRVTPEKEGSSGRILGAIWDGGAAGIDEFVSFAVLAQNPNGSAELSWSAIQTYADGSEVQWFGPQTSQFPATVTRVESGAEPSLADILAGAALLLSISALGFTLLVWRRLRAIATRARTPAVPADVAVPHPVETAQAQPR
jgi:uncharacterized protein YcnI